MMSADGVGFLLEVLTFVWEVCTVGDGVPSESHALHKRIKAARERHGTRRARRLERRKR